MQEHGRNPADAPGFRCAAGILNTARVKRRVADRRVEVRQFLETKTAKLATTSAALTNGNRWTGTPSDNGIMSCDYSGHRQLIGE